MSFAIDWTRFDVDASAESGNDTASTSAPKEAIRYTTGLPHTDTGLAERFAWLFGDRVRYCHPWKKWLAWDGRRWRLDDTGAVDQLAKRTSRSILVEAAACEDEPMRARLREFARTAESAARRRAMVTLAMSEPPIPILPESLDTDPMLLNVENGTLDLRTGILRPHRIDDFLTKLAPVEYYPDFTAPVWDAFLTRIFAGNQALISYVHRLLGYCLTGDVSEQVLPIWHGGGANGKSTAVNVVLDVLGPDYAMKAPPDILMAKRGETHPTERADLHGKRFVAAVETEENRRLAESLTKELTGGDKVRARRMREDFWQFAPTHKVILACNHRPEVRGTDHAIWRRLRLVPFEVTIPDAEQDKHLAEKLRKESPGVLAWLVRGCQDWLEHGLGLPPEVETATANYRAEQDGIGEFISECCCVGDEFRAKAGNLYQHYRTWSEKAGESPVKQRQFGTALTERAFRRYKNNGVWYHGLALQEDVQTA